MKYEENREQAGDLAIEALRRMAELGQPANPHNFTIWYVYLSGRDPGFNEMFEHLLNSGKELTEKRSAQLYARCIAFDSDGELSSRDAALYNASAQVESTVDRVLDLLRDAGADTARFGEALAGLGGELESAPRDQVHRIVTGLLEETHRMAERSKDVEQSLAASNAEIADLREQITVISNEAVTDALTGLRNRKAFDEALAEQTLAARTEDEPISLLMLDIDHFKKFNDTYGHPLGDAVIRLVGGCLTACTKGRDVACRYGGEEFAVILPETDLGGALTVAEQIRSTVAGKTITRKRTNESLGSVTLSIGAAEWRRSEPLDEWVQRADQALYRAKQGGRNRVEGGDESRRPRLSVA